MRSMFIRMPLLVCIVGSAGQPAAARARPIVAVFDLEVRGIELDRRTRSALGDYFCEGLAASGTYRIVPRDQLRRRLAALKRRSYRPCYDRSCQLELGRELAAGKSLATRLMRIGRKCVAASTLYDLRTAASEGGAVAEGGCSVDALRELLARLVQRLAGRVVSLAKSATGMGLATMAQVPAGPFLRGSRAGEGEPDERPRRRIHLDAFLVDRTEVTVEQYRRCVEAGQCTSPAGGPGCNWARGERSSHPVNCVDWSQAVAHCAWAGKRLPTEAEWEKAARGTTGATYPWGEAAPGCRLAVMGGCGASGTSPAGSREPCDGVHDMAGNVWEWVSDRYQQGHYRIGPNRDPGGPTTGESRVARGGGWQDDARDLRAARRDHALPHYQHVDLGFRCAQGIGQVGRP